METKIYKPRLINAKQMSIDYPDSFSYWEEDIANIKVGNVVKVANNWERFWVIVKEIEGNKIIGEVNNGLVGNLKGKPSPYNCGNLIFFKRENIYQIWEK
jgi:hypothetical protein